MRQDSHDLKMREIPKDFKHIHSVETVFSLYHKEPTRNLAFIPAGMRGQRPFCVFEQNGKTVSLQSYSKLPAEGSRAIPTPVIGYKKNKEEKI